MQLRFETELTSKEYVSQEAWQDASLTCCPMHPQGGCSFARHGTYERVKPPGTKIPRWYCPESHCTFSLLADCFTARLSGTLCEIETVVVEVEGASSLEAAADQSRLDIELPGAIRWTRRRVKAVHACLTILLGLLPELFIGCQPTVTAFSQRLRVDFILPVLREIAAVHLGYLPPPLGFSPPSCSGGEAKRPLQQQTGPDPPSLLQ